MVNSKLSPGIGSSHEAVEPHQRKGITNFFKCYHYPRSRISICYHVYLKKYQFEIFPFLHIIVFHELKALPAIKDKNFDNSRTIEGLS